MGLDLLGNPLDATGFLAHLTSFPMRSIAQHVSVNTSTSDV